MAIVGELIFSKSRLKSKNISASLENPSCRIEMGQIVQINFLNSLKETSSSRIKF